MLVSLIRHGEAEPPAPGQPDRDRALTKRGIQGTEQVIQLARKKGLSPSRILASPYLRTQQTASIAARILDQEASAIHPSVALIPEGTPSGLWDEVRLYAEEPSLLLVTHLPLIAEAADWIADPVGAHAGIPRFSPATMVCFEVDASQRVPGGSLLWNIVT